MAFSSGLYRFQEIHEDEAMQIALSESLHIYKAFRAEEENLARAIQLSLVEEIPLPADCSPTETKNDIGSDPADTLRSTVREGGSVRETFILALEEGGDVEISLQVESSDDGEVGTTIYQEEPAEVDLWDDHREMSFPRKEGKAYGEERKSELKRGALEYFSSHDTNTTLIEEPIPPLDTTHKTESERELSSSLLGTGTRVVNAPLKADIQKRETHNAPNFKQESLNLTSAEKERDSPTLMQYTMSDDMVAIPNTGTFKRKERFDSLASPQSIEKTLHLSGLRVTLPYTPQQSSSHHTQSPLSHNPTQTTTPSIMISPKPSTSTAPKPYDAEEERRSRNYTSLLRAQRRYAEKLSIPTGPDFRFTAKEWDSLGEQLPIEEWEAGFLVAPPRLKIPAVSGASAGKHESSERIVKKENLLSAWKGKEKERVGDAGMRAETGEDEAVTLSMAF